MPYLKLNAYNSRINETQCSDTKIDWQNKETAYHETLSK